MCSKLFVYQYFLKETDKNFENIFLPKFLNDAISRKFFLCELSTSIITYE